MATVAPPAASVPRSAMCHSGRFPAQIATRSWDSSPSSSKKLANLETARAYSDQLIGAHRPPVLKWRAGASPSRLAVAWNAAGTVSGPVASKGSPREPGSMPPL
jgi:hypothetical protein